MSWFSSIVETALVGRPGGGQRGDPAHAMPRTGTNAAERLAVSAITRWKGQAPQKASGRLCARPTRRGMTRCCDSPWGATAGIGWSASFPPDGSNLQCMKNAGKSPPFRRQGSEKTDEKQGGKPPARQRAQKKRASAGRCFSQGPDIGWRQKTNEAVPERPEHKGIRLGCFEARRRASARPWKKRAA